MKKMIITLLITLNLSNILTAGLKTYDYIMYDVFGKTTINEVEFMSEVIYKVEELGL